jgi:hypothetical protein
MRKGDLAITVGAVIKREVFVSGDEDGPVAVCVLKI